MKKRLYLLVFIGDNILGLFVYLYIYLYIDIYSNIYLFRIVFYRLIIVFFIRRFSFRKGCFIE